MMDPALTQEDVAALRAAASTVGDEAANDFRRIASPQTVLLLLDELALHRREADRILSRTIPTEKGRTWVDRSGVDECLSFLASLTDDASFAFLRRVRCSHCGDLFAADRPVPTHDFPRPGRAVCPGSGQPGREVYDRRPLGKDA